MIDPEQRAMELLRSPYFFSKFLKAIRRAGLVGEQINALIVYLVVISRLLPDPLHLFVKGPSGSGKNFLVDNVAEFLPPSHVYTVSSTSANVLSFEGRKLAHKVLYVKELNKLAGSLIQTRLLISEKELVREVTIRKGGKLTKKRYITKGPICSVSTTTEDELEIDDESRRISIWTDTSEAQTQLIVKATWCEADQTLPPEELEVWHFVQRLLRTRARVPIVFPNRFRALAALVDSHELRLRRYAPAFKKACQTVCLIRSYRKSDEEVEKSGELRVSFIDVAISQIILGAALAQSLYGREQEDAVLGALKRVSAVKNGGPVRASSIAAEMGISIDQTYSLLRDALRRNVIRRVNGPQQKNLKLYLPAAQRSFLPDPETIFEKLKIDGRLRFVHPLTEQWVAYGKGRKKR